MYKDTTKCTITEQCVNTVRCLYVIIISTLRRTWLQEYPKPLFAFKILLLSISCSSQ